jgi:hypothetical protein
MADALHHSLLSGSLHYQLLALARVALT